LQPLPQDVLLEVHAGIHARFNWHLLPCRHRLERDHNCSALAAAATTAASAKAEDDWLKSFGSNSPKFKNAPNTAAGDAKVPEADRFLLAVNFPQALQRPPLCAPCPALL
jgi:hypothetical protein